MAARSFLTCACLLSLMLAVPGCKRPIAPAASLDHPPAVPSPPKDLAMLRYDTGDVQEWPDYHFPLEHSFDIPEVPPEIVGPFSLDVLPALKNEAARQ